MVNLGVNIQTVGELKTALKDVPDNALLNIGNRNNGFSLDEIYYDGISVGLETKEAGVFELVTDRKIDSAKQCLMDNGIAADEAATVLQALGYILMDTELFPEAPEQPELSGQHCSMKAINIDWDVDCEEDRANLPTEIEIPEGLEDEDDISDYLSDVTGFCHKGFELVDKAKQDVLYNREDLRVTDYPYDFGNGYKVQTIFANKTKDGVYGDIYDFRSAVEREHPGAEIMTGYCVIDEALGLVPEGCNDWNDTISAAIQDYEEHVLTPGKERNEDVELNYTEMNEKGDAIRETLFSVKSGWLQDFFGVDNHSQLEARLTNSDDWDPAEILMNAQKQTECSGLEIGEVTEFDRELKNNDMVIATGQSMENDQADLEIIAEFLAWVEEHESLLKEINNKGFSVCDMKNYVHSQIDINNSEEKRHKKEQAQISDQILPHRARMLLFSTLELLRKEIRSKFSDWKDADDWLFAQLDMTKGELAQIYEGRDTLYYDTSAVDLEAAQREYETNIASENIQQHSTVNIYRNTKESLAEYHKAIRYWSNALGELAGLGENEMAEDVLPVPLHHAYKEIFFEGEIGSMQYLVETDEGYGIALINEYDAVTAKNSGISMDNLFKTVIKDAHAIAKDPLFANARIFVAEYAGFDNSHDLVVVLPADIPTDVFFKTAARLDELAYHTCFRKGENTLTAKIQEAQARVPESQTANYQNIDHGR